MGQFERLSNKKRFWLDPLEGLVRDEDAADATSPAPKPLQTKKPKSYNPLRRRPSCPTCDDSRWNVVDNHDRYRDPFLSCGGCGSTFRMDMTALDLTFAWRDEIPMPDEVKTRNDGHHEQLSYGAERRRRTALIRTALGDPAQFHLVEQLERTEDDR